MSNCTKCGAEYSEGTKFCQKCGNKLQTEVIENPVCPRCKKGYPTGVMFCENDGTKLVSVDQMIPRCSKCGKQYGAETKFCPLDGGRIVTGIQDNSNDIVTDVSKTINNVLDKHLGKVEKWHGFVTFWTILSIVVNAILFIIGLTLISPYQSAGFYISLLCGMVNIAALVMLLKRQKLGFWILAGSAVFNFVCLIASLGGGGQAVFGLFSIAIWFGILQIKCDGVTAWQTLK
ncbi:MAG: zinc ribbon domain-containing protein [Bacteroidales bacterium]|jgi:hypothetical protein|nr:zinc ribbon domain-containing protein [Bacteroidales bacterium]